MQAEMSYMLGNGRIYNKMIWEILEIHFLRYFFKHTFIDQKFIENYKIDVGFTSYLMNLFLVL